MKKDTISDNPTPAEWGAIIGFVVTIFITLQATLSIFVGVICFSITLFFHKFLINKKKRKLIREIGNTLIIVLIFCFFTDTILTYYSVFYLKIANEMNFGVLILWGFFGIFGGEIVRYLIITFIFSVISYQLNHKSFNRNATAFILILFLLLAWLCVIANNIYQLIKP